MTVTPPAIAPSSEETRATALTVASDVLRDVYHATRVADHAALEAAAARLETALQTLQGFYRGEYVPKMVRTLNRIVTTDTAPNPFRRTEKDRKDPTFEWITESIDSGLPVMRGWNAPDCGCHAVLVVGYWLGEEDWLTIHDPGGATEVSWSSLMAQARESFAVGYCRTDHRGPRPLKSVTEGEGEGEKTETLQWTPTRDRPGGDWVNPDHI